MWFCLGAPSIIIFLSDSSSLIFWELTPPDSGGLVSLVIKNVFDFTKMTKQSIWKMIKCLWRLQTGWGTVPPEKPVSNDGRLQRSIAAQYDQPASANTKSWLKRNTNTNVNTKIIWSTGIWNYFFLVRGIVSFLVLEKLKTYSTGASTNRRASRTGCLSDSCISFSLRTQWSLVSKFYWELYICIIDWNMLIRRECVTPRTHILPATKEYLPECK